jgi:RimJ/RimL family protein N-acetyltransferase
MTDFPTLPGRVRRAQPADAAALAELCRRTFIAAFGAQNRPEDTELHVATYFGEAIQRRELEDPDVVTVVIDEGDDLGGYAQIRRHPPPPSVTGPEPLELRRFYVEARLHGRGAAQQLMAGARAAAAELGGRTLWLSCWEENPRAIAFYTKSGFRAVGTATFVVGSDVQSDLIMAAPIRAESS